MVLRGVPNSRAESPHSVTTDHHNPSKRKSRDVTVTDQNGSLWKGLIPIKSCNLFTRSAEDSGSVELESSSRHQNIEELESSHHHSH